jgi:DNA polymerase III subunit delta
VSPDPAPVLMLWGESAFLLREAALDVLGGVRATEIDAADWRSGATADLATPSLFGEERGLLVTDAQDLPPEGIEEVARYAAQPAGARLVLTFVVSARSRGPARGTLKALGDSVEVRKVAVERRDLADWVRRRAAARGLPATSQGVQTLIQTVGEDPALLVQAVEQVGGSHPEQGLTPETVRAQFRGLGDRRIWEVCDAAFGGDLPGGMRALVGMLESGEEPLVMLAGIASRLRDLIRVRGLPPRTPLAEVARRAGLRFDWQARRYRDQARRFTDDGLGRIHGDLVEADRALKQGGSGEPVLARVVSRIAEVAGAETRARSGSV